MNIIHRIKSLPLATKRYVGLGVVIALFIALPVFIWALVTQQLFFSKKAAGEVSITSPLIIQEAFTGNGALDSTKWNWSGSNGSSAVLENDKLKVSVASGHDEVGGNDATVFPYVNSTIPYIAGDFNVSVDLNPITTTSGYEELKFGAYTISIRRNKSAGQETIEAWGGSSASGVLDNKLISVDLPVNTGSVKVRLQRTLSRTDPNYLFYNYNTFYDLGNGEIQLVSTGANGIPESEQLPHLVVENNSPDYPTTTGFFDDYTVTASMVVTTGTPSICTAVNKIITVTPYTNTSGTCHDIQTAIDAVDGDGYTIQIQNGDYNITSSLIVNNKSNLKITGTPYGNIDQTWLSFNTTNGGGYGIKVVNSSGSINWLHAEGITPNGLISIQNSNNFGVHNTYLFGTNSHTLDAQNSGYISISDSEIKSSAGGLEFDNISNGIQVFNLKITNTDNAISINNSSNVNLDKSLIINNRESAITAQNIHTFSIDHNTILNNATENGTSPALYIFGTLTGLSAITNNLVLSNLGAGIKIDNQNSISDFSHNDIWTNTGGNYVGMTNPTGTNGNISTDPLLDMASGYYCLLANSPAIYRDRIENYSWYMGHSGPCTTSTPPPTPTSSLNIITNSFINGRVGESYRNFFYGEKSIYTTDPQLTLTATNLPPGLSVPNALCGTSYPQGGAKRIECALDGIPTTAGNYTVHITLSDNLGNSISKDVPILILSSLPSPSPTPVPGDVNGDGHVNIVDIGILIDNYRIFPPTDPRADLNHDGIVNIVDIGIIVDNYEF